MAIQAVAMKKRCLLTLGVLLIAVVGVVSWIALGRSQRTFNGKPESYWIRSLATGWTPTSTFDAEWRDLGPQAVPILVGALEQQPGSASKAYSKMWPKLPGVVQQLLPSPVNYRTIQMSAFAVLAEQKTKPKIPVALFVRALKDQEWIVRFSALSCLNLAILPKAGAEDDQFLPLIIDAAQDPEWQVRMVAVLGLGYYTNHSDLVMPILTNALANPYPDVRIRAAMAMYQVDPTAAERLGGLKVTYDCLKSSGLHGSGFLAAELLKKLGKPLPNEQQ